MAKRTTRKGNTERKRAEEALAVERDRLRVLAGRLIAAQEEERRLVAYDIHDGLGQMITAAGMHLDLFRARRSFREEPDVEEALSNAERCLKNAIAEMRRIVSELRPSLLEDLGLSEAVRQHLKDAAARNGWTAEFRGGLSGPRLPPAVETVVFRIVQEALANAAKHAQTRRIALTLKEEEGLLFLEVRDWGKGFNVAETLAAMGRGRQVGLFSMKERAQFVGGELTIVSTPEEGTAVRVTVPIARAEEDEERRMVAVAQRNDKVRRPNEATKGGIRVLIADDHPMVRQGLRSMLNIKGIQVIGEATDGREAVELVRDLNPDVILMDVRMPDMDGLAATEIVKEEAPSTAVIIVTSYESKDYLRRAIEAGAAGYLLKGMSRDSLIEAIRLVRGGGSLVDAKLLAELLQEMGVSGSRFQGAEEGALEALSPRERQVLQLLIHGLTNKEIAQQMHYSVGTVKNVVQRVIEKLGVSDRTQAAVYAVRAGLNLD